jgi:hypothetical protein
MLLLRFAIVVLEEAHTTTYTHAKAEPEALADGSVCGMRCLLRESNRSADPMDGVQYHVFCCTINEN